MSTEIRVKDFESTENLESYLQNHTESIIEATCPNSPRYSLTVTVGENAHRNQERKPNFECSINLKFDGSKKVYKIIKQGPNFYDVVNDAGITLKKVLRRRHNLNSSHNHNRLIPSEESFQAS